MSIEGGPKRRYHVALEQGRRDDPEPPMSYSLPNSLRKQPLWNVSFLPTVEVASASPERGPEPPPGRALDAPALLSISERATEAAAA